MKRRLVRSMVQHSFQALGTTWWIELFDEKNDTSLHFAFGEVEALVQTFEANYSRFKSNSKLSKLNQTGLFTSPDAEWRDILTLGQALYSKTNGAFNMLTGDTLSNRGYNADYTFVAKDTPEIFHNPLTAISVTDEMITLNQGLVDIGGYGKGYLIDRVQELLLSLDFKYFLINGGGDIYATSQHDFPIAIYLEHPLEPGTYIGQTSLYHQSFAASSPFKRQWVHKEQTYTHIVSKDTLEPLASFVKATTAAEADAFATTALLISETELEALATKENFSFARYNPKTAELWKIRSF